jgi:hypothetical protein
MYYWDIFLSWRQSEEKETSQHLKMPRGISTSNVYDISYSIWMMPHKGNNFRKIPITIQLFLFELLFYLEDVYGRGPTTRYADAIRCYWLFKLTIQRPVCLPWCARIMHVQHVLFERVISPIFEIISQNVPYKI